MKRQRGRAARKRARKSPSWTPAHVRRLFWRAGFGATPAEADFWARQGKVATLSWVLDGSAPAGADPPIPKPPPPAVPGKALDPVNEPGSDVLVWLDKMVRAPRPLVERMTLFWHDHFATRREDQPLLVRQNETLRKHALGDFRELLGAVTTDPAMQFFLSLADSSKTDPNENYARELMELFTLGRGYTEGDIREAAKALTGFRRKNVPGGVDDVYYDPKAHDDSSKTIFGKSGNHDWQAVLDLCVAHRAHPAFLVTKLWSSFIVQPLPRHTRARLVSVYREKDRSIRAVLFEILRHPWLYTGLDAPDMVKSPVVYLAGALRTTGNGVRTDAWTGLLDQMGQRPYDPPSVAGWDGGPAWLSTNTVRARFATAAQMLRKGGELEVPDGSTPPALGALEQIERARAATAAPWLSPGSERSLRRSATSWLALPAADDKARQRRADECQRALRTLMLAGPDQQLH